MYIASDVPLITLYTYQTLDYDLYHYWFLYTTYAITMYHVISTHLNTVIVLKGDELRRYCYHTRTQLHWITL